MKNVWCRWLPRRLLGAALVATGAAGFAIATGSIGLVRVLEWSVLDQLFHWRPPENPDPRTVIVTIGEADIHHVRDWPMSDRIMARVIRRIAADNPRAIGLDIYRDIPVEPGHTELKALWQTTPNFVGIYKVAPPTIAPPPFLEVPGPQVAASDLLLDLDSRVRRTAVLLGGEEGLGLQMALLYLAADGIAPEVIDGSRFYYGIGEATLKPLRPGEAGYRQDELGGYQMLLDYRQPWQDRFILVPLRQLLPTLNGIANADMEPLPTGFFRDRMVFIGAEAPSLNDTYPTPHGSAWFSPRTQTPGVAIHATLASQIVAAALDGQTFLLPLPLWAERGWIWVWAFGSAVLGQRFVRDRWRSGVGLLMLPGAIVAISYLSFLNGWVVPIFKPALAAVLATAVSIGASFWERLRQYYRALEEANRTLESRVRQRTAELAAANSNLAGANAKILELNRELQDENRRLAAEVEVTQRMQEMVLPKVAELRAITELDIAAYMKPAKEVGGDYYDVFPRGEDTVICIGDVTGHGLESGVLMLMAQTGIRALADSNITDPVHFLSTLNHTLYNNLVRMNSDKNMTLVMVVYRHGRACISGQHEEAIVIRVDGRVERIDTIDLGFPIGLDTNIDGFIHQHDIRLQSGDLIALYTDGITESENPEKVQYGLERLCSVLVRWRHLAAAEIVDRAILDVREHIGLQQVYDDITLVICKQLPLRSGPFPRR